MQELGLKSKIRAKKRYFRKSDNLSSENVLNRNFFSDLPKQKLVTDVTYLRINQKTYYLSVVQDLFNNEVISYTISRQNDGPLVLDSIKDALKLVKRNNDCIIHSDQGYQYTSVAYTLLLKELGIIKSMSRRGNCLDNACIESFFGHLKVESIYLNRLRNYDELKALIDQYIYFYNNERIQAKLNKMTPIEYRQAFEFNSGF